MKQITPTDAQMRQSRLFPLFFAADQPVSALKLSPCGCFSGRWRGVVRTSHQEWDRSTLRNARRRGRFLNVSPL